MGLNNTSRAGYKNRLKVLVLSAVCAISLTGCETMVEIAEAYADEASKQQTSTSTYSPNTYTSNPYNGYTPTSSSSSNSSSSNSSNTSYNRCSTNCSNSKTSSLYRCSTYDYEPSKISCNKNTHDAYARCVKRCG